MPRIEVDQHALKEWGNIWLGLQGSITKKGAQTDKKSFRFDRKQGMDFGVVFDRVFAQSLAIMLGGVPVLEPENDSLLPPHPNCVEIGKTRIVGGIRPQNYDAAYRPDGPRIVYDSKTLNDQKSIGKNWQNMINDLATEATTVHTRFPFCIVCFFVILPRPALQPPQERAIIRTLERLGSRGDELDQHHLAEAIALIVWNPIDGSIDPNVPPTGSNLRLDTMHQRIHPAYVDRYKNLPPHEAEEMHEAGDDDSEADSG
jgi:hypothetical protein